MSSRILEGLDKGPNCYLLILSIDKTQFHVTINLHTSYHTNQHLLERP